MKHVTCDLCGKDFTDDEKTMNFSVVYSYNHENHNFPSSTTPIGRSFDVCEKCYYKFRRYSPACIFKAVVEHYDDLTPDEREELNQ
jgi:hypothetical protein